jgi:hypothetical protein
MSRSQTVIRSARFIYSPYTATEMQGFAQVPADAIRARIQRGQNIYDQAAAPLKPGLPGRRGYPDDPDYKAARGLNPIRDWNWSGHPAMPEGPSWMMPHWSCRGVVRVTSNRIPGATQLPGQQAEVF